MPKGITIPLADIIKIVLFIIGLGGYIIGVGDRLYAKKAELTDIKLKLAVIEVQTRTVYDAFIKAAEYAKKK